MLKLRLIIIGIILMAAPLSAQQRVHTFHQLSTRQGLTSNQYTYYIFKDAQGFVWASSISGLNRFDGYRVRQYHSVPEDSTTLISEFSSQGHFYEDEQQDLWFSNKGCLMQYVRKDDNFRRHYFTLPNGELAKEYYFWAHLHTEKQEVYVSGENHLFVLNAKKPEEKYYVDSVFVGIKDRMFTLDNGNQILLRQREKSKMLDLRIYRDHARIDQKVVAAPRNSSLADTWLVEGGHVLVASTVGLHLLDLKTLQYADLPSDYLGKEVTNIKSLAQLKNNNWLVNTEEGNIFVYDLAGRKFIDQIWIRNGGEAKPLSEETVTMTVDADENIWLCTEGEGIKYTSLSKPKFLTCAMQETAEKKNFKALVEGGNGEVYGLLSKFVVKMTARDTQYYDLPVGENYLDSSMEILVDSKGRVWVGSLSELFLLEVGSNSFRPVNLLPEGSSTQLPGYTYLRELPNGDLLIGPNQVGIFRISADLQRSTWVDSTMNRTALMVADNSGGFLHANFDDKLRLGKFSLDELIVDTTITDFGFAPTAIFDAQRNQYWIGTSNGLWTARAEADKWVIEQDSLIAGGYIINSISRSDPDLLWFSSAEGLYSYQLTDGSLKLYREADGLASADFGVDAFLEHSDGRMILASSNGLTVFRPSEIMPTVAAASPTITAISINDQDDVFQDYTTNGAKNPSLVTGLRLPFNLNSIDINFSAMEYSDPAACRYQFQLVGAENSAKRPITSEPRVSFTNLGDGTYTLNVWAWNSDGIRSEEPRTLQLTILPPLYRTWWAYLIYVLLVASIVLGVIWVRLRSIRKLEKQQLLTAQAQARIAETETSVLRLQMNPHFIFNGLNSVGAFIMGEDKLAAHEYLGSFADLMREILNRSTKPLTRLDEAIEFLEKYLETEQMRVGEKLRYSIEEKDGMDSFSYYIPTMILQPFVENSIIHGVGGRPQGGLITVRFSIDEENEFLIAEVEDDGRGRRMQGRGTKKQGPNALGITQKRMDMLNGMYSSATSTSTAPASAAPAESGEGSGKYRYEIKDLKHPDGSGRGTHVLLYLPITYHPKNESSIG